LGTRKKRKNSLFFYLIYPKVRRKKLKQSRNDAYNQIASKEAYKTSSMGGNQG